MCWRPLKTIRGRIARPAYVKDGHGHGILYRDHTTAATKVHRQGSRPVA